MVSLAQQSSTRKLSEVVRRLAVPPSASLTGWPDIERTCLRLGTSFDQWQATALVGTPEQVSEKVQTYVDLGCTGFIPWCSDYPDTESMDLFASEVMPNFR